MENEIWKDIPGYAGIYQVSNYVRVKSLPKSYIICNKYVVTAKEKVLKQRKVKGYKIIELNHKGIARRFPVHVLVAKMFIPNPNNYPEIDHIDTDRANNKFSNLRWCTHSMNMNNPITKEKIRNIPRIKGKENPLFEGKSPDAKAVIQYDMKNNIVAKYNSVHQAARKNDFSYSCIARVCRGERKTYKKFKWSYETESNYS